MHIENILYFSSSLYVTYLYTGFVFPHILYICVTPVPYRNCFYIQSIHISQLGENTGLGLLLLDDAGLKIGLGLLISLLSLMSRGFSNQKEPKIPRSSRD